MMEHSIYIYPGGRVLRAENGENLLRVLQKAGLAPDAPCGGRGTCGKCKVTADGKEVLACRTEVTADMEILLPEKENMEILTQSPDIQCAADGGAEYAAAFDIGTTTLVCYLMDGKTGMQLQQASCVNPQSQYGADVISRIQYVLHTDGQALSACVQQTMDQLLMEVSRKQGIDPDKIGVISIVGNTAMHHLLLGIDPRPLTILPYMPSIKNAMELNGAALLTVCPDAQIRILPNIAGFVGSDTVGCMLATRFDELEELTLMIDIGTNGEMVLGDQTRRIACSTAAGPAFEGAKIRCGMRGAAGAVDHAWLEKGTLCWSVIGGTEAEGICGSGLLDLVACLLERKDILTSGRMTCGKEYRLEGTGVFLSQKDVREVQLAKAAIRAGIELLCMKLGVKTADIRKVYLAGAFGNYMDPASACAIGMIPPVLRGRIEPIGNGAGTGARLCAASRKAYEDSSEIARRTEFLELASMPEFNDCYLKCLSFEEQE